MFPDVAVNYYLLVPAIGMHLYLTISFLLQVYHYAGFLISKKCTFCFPGPYGTNHGIEIHEDVVNYSNKKLEEFRKISPALDEYEFCEPKFVKGIVMGEVEQFLELSCCKSAVMYY